MLKDDFYLVRDIQRNEGMVTTQIRFNSAHRIFAGHFPGQPVVPGVCMLEMVKEMLSTVTGKSLLLQKADHLKFLTVIDPGKTPEVDMEIRYKQLENGNLLADAHLSREGVFFFKCRGEWRVEEGSSL